MPGGPWQPSLRRGRGFGPGHGGFGLGFEGKEGFEGERERGNKQKDLCRREHTGILYSLSYTMSLREREESLESLVVEETLGLKRV